MVCMREQAFYSAAGGQESHVELSLTSRVEDRASLAPLGICGAGQETRWCPNCTVHRSIASTLIAVIAETPM